MKTHDDFEAVIRDQFAEAETIIPVVQKYNYGDILKDGFHFIQLAIKGKKLTEIPYSVGTSLTTINDFLRTVPLEADKRILEDLTALLFSAQIEEIRSLEGGSECIQDSLEVMKTTCTIKGYDFDLLKQKLGLDSLITRKPKIHSTGSPVTNTKSYYSWEGTPKNLKEVSNVLKIKQITDKPIHFKKVFHLRDNPHLRLNVSPEQLEFLVYLIHRFYKKGLVTIIGGNGHFVPLIRHLCDLEGKPIEKKGNKILEKIKRNDSLLQKLDGEVGKILRINCKESLRQLGDKDQSRTE